MGTPTYSIPTLLMLLKKKYNIVCVITQEDKVQGRGKKLLAPPIKGEAQNHGIPVLQPASLKTSDFESVLISYKPQIYITIAYGKIIPGNILDIPEFGCINVHASLLPKYRGPAPIWWAVINGDKNTGITTMYSDEGVDTGDIILKTETKIGKNETTGMVHDRLALLSAQVLSQTLDLITNGKMIRQKQNDELSTYAPQITKNTGHIDWNKSAEEIRNLIRGTNPYPYAYSIYNKCRMKIIEAKSNNSVYKENPGTIVKVMNDHFIVSCLGSSLEVYTLQMPNKKILPVADYLNGNKIEEGIILE